MLTLLVLCSVIFWETGFVEFVLGGILLIFLSITAYGSFQIRANYYIKSINLGRKKGVALTFDDGPDPVTTPQILSILREADVKATFFVIGKKAEQYPELIRQIDSEGHIVANHSYSHSYFIGFFSTLKLSADIAKCNRIIAETIGKTPVFFRPPFGVTNPRFGKALRMNGMKSVGWSVRSFDTRAKNKYQLIDRVVRSIKKRDIVLLHDRMPITVEALPDMIGYCRSKRLRLEPLNIVVNQEAYVVE
jgi:peptidoglycan-N-acetylglucosamine deacetylase